VLVLDSGAVSFLGQRSPRVGLLLSALRAEGLWPPIVPTPVLVECLTGHPGRDAITNRLLRACEIAAAPSERAARRAAQLRTAARRGSAVDALVVAAAEPGGTVLTSDPADLRALADHSRAVQVIAV
jgi:hypothetical protein